MCGITGGVTYGGELDVSAAVVRAMTRTLRRRGPDDEGVWTGDGVGLGHRRLAVIDPPGGRQPMTVRTPDGSVTLVYSGEVYNYVELRAELRGHGRSFATASDTEVVLHAYVVWGEDAAKRLDGIFAFAVWDERLRRLVLVRDRLGVKPLYYYPLPDGVLFGSEPKAILAHPAARHTVDLDGLRAALAYVLTVPGVACAGMQEVTPGHVLTVDAAGLRSRAYWRLPAREHTDDRRTTVARVRTLLTDVVRRQLVADVPVGILLSGGLDSSTLTALAAGQGSGGVETFDVDFAGYAEHFVNDAERADPDHAYAAAVACHLGTRHRTVVLDGPAVTTAELRRAVVAAYDVPPGFGDRDRSMHLLFRAVRASATVALSGEAADELFGGYWWFHDPAVRRTPGFPWVVGGYDTYALAPGALHPELEAAVDLRGYLAQRYAVAAAEVEHLDTDDPHERGMRTASHLTLTHALRVLLDRKDRLSMATGLEVRVPYCDHHLVEYVHNVPWSFKYVDGREKSLLRAAAADLLPMSVLHRVKTAYPSMRDPSYLAALAAEAATLAADPAHQVFCLVRPAWLRAAACTEVLTRSARDRNSVEWVLNLAAWIDVSQPEFRLP